MKSAKQRQIDERADPCIGLRPQRCKVCGRVDHIDFHVSDEVWNKIVPIEFRGRVLCIACFDYFASARNVQYAEHLDREICFVGAMAGFTAIIRDRAGTNTAE